MKRLCESATNDSIGDLPANAIERILTFLPIKAAARTGILSRNWRHRWRSIPQLVFDGRFAPLPETVEYVADDNKVMMNIYEALLVHDGPIAKFVLAIPGLSSCPQIDKLILHLSSKGVREMVLRFWSVEYPKLHSALFSAFALNSLKLQRCEFPAPPSYVGFGQLALLQLEDMNLPRGFFESFLPCCPLLEELRIVGVSERKLVFVAPSLKRLYIKAILGRICFKYTPLLSVLSVVDIDDFIYTELSAEYRHDPVELFAALPALEQLTLGIELMLLLAAGYVPYRLPTSLHHLKVLEVPRLLLNRLPQARVLVCLIMSSPNLHTLTIRIDDDEDHPPSEVIASLNQLLEAEEQPGGICCFQRLEEFNIQESRGTQVELDLVRFVLATAPILRRISITPEDELCPRKGMKFLKEVTLFKRISKEAEVRYLWNDEVDRKVIKRARNSCSEYSMCDEMWDELLSAEILN